MEKDRKQTIAEEIQRKLKIVRKARNYTLKEVSELSKKSGFKISVSSLSEWENGEHEMSINSFFALCKVYNISFYSLFSCNVENISKILDKKNEYKNSNINNISAIIGEKIREKLKKQNMSVTDFTDKMIEYANYLDNGKNYSLESTSVYNFMSNRTVLKVSWVWLSMKILNCSLEELTHQSQNFE